MEHSEAARIEFGRSLVAQRERRGLSRDDVARLTRVPLLLIGALEDGEHEKWPERVFTLNALKSYAGAVGLPADELVSRFDSLAEAPKVDSFDPARLEAERRSHAITAVVIAVAAIAVVCVGAALRSSFVFAQRAAWSAR